MQVKKREGESTSSMIYRFTKRTQQSGILREAKKRRYYARPTSRLKRRVSALAKARKKVEIEKAKKLGLIV